MSETATHVGDRRVDPLAPVADGVLRVVGRLMRHFDAMLIPLEPDDALD